MPAQRSNDLFENSTMTFGQHLEELRTCLFKAVLGLVGGVIIGFMIGGYVVDFIQSPLRQALEKYYQDQSIERVDAVVKELGDKGVSRPDDAKRLKAIVRDEKMLPERYYVDPRELLDQLKQRFPGALDGVKVSADNPDPKVDHGGLMPLFLFRTLADDRRTHVLSLSAQEPFSIYLKASMLAGAVIASPWIFYQLWAFVGAGLYPHEKRYVHIFLPFSICLFSAGAALAFFFVFKPVLSFLFYFNSVTKVDPEPRLSEWLGFVMMLPLGFGLAFQLPLVMLFLERIGVASVKTYLGYWRVAILIIAVLAMMLTPDPYSMMLMVVPLTGLYFGGVALCRYLPRQRRPHELEAT